MKKVLYITAFEVPYRVRFFNELAKHCDLTVLFEAMPGKHRNRKWSTSEEIQFKTEYLRLESVQRSKLKLNVKILKYLRADYDAIIFGCVNTKTQAAAIVLMRLLRKPYIINLDGETMWDDVGFKRFLKRFVLKGADKYLVAGEKCGESIAEIAKGRCIVPYYFSSLLEREIEEHAQQVKECKRNETVLVVGQYFDYKGMDVVLEAARLDQSIPYKFVGMGGRTELFQKDFAGKIPKNVEIIPFLQKKDLEKEYCSCAMMVLPSRRECWGLVINEAASFGTPIVSTWGSGAAIEFLADAWPQYLAKIDDAKDLCAKIVLLRDASKEEYVVYLKEKASRYTVEKMATQHLKAL